MPWPVIYFPVVTKFIKKLPPHFQESIVSYVELLENYGLDLRAPVSKKIQNNLFELRLLGQKSLRLLYTFKKGKFYVLNVFKKKSQKIPRKEINLAVDRMKLII